MKKNTLGAVLALSLAAPLLMGLLPPPVTLEGLVMNRASDRPVPGATVRLLVGGERTVTDEVGRFSFGERDVRGPDTLLISHPDFLAVRLPLGSPGDSVWNLTVSVVPGTFGVGGGPPRVSRGGFFR